jgi:hypothetical protein
MADQIPKSGQPGQETLIRRLKRGLLSEIPGEDTASKPAGQAPHAVKSWSDTLATISTGVVAIATVMTWIFGASRGFPAWFSYVLTFFVVVAVFKYSEVHVRRLFRFLSLRRYLRQQRFRLVDIIQGFGDLISFTLEDSVTSVLRKTAEKTGRPIVDPDIFAYPNQLLSNILLRLSDAGRNITIAEFKGALNELSTLIQFCSQFYFRKPVGENRLSGVTPAERNSLELARENFADYVRRFQAFHDEVQLRMGTGTRAHFEIPRPI